MLSPVDLKELAWEVIDDVFPIVIQIVTELECRVEAARRRLRGEDIYVYRCVPGMAMVPLGDSDTESEAISSTDDGTVRRSNDAPRTQKGDGRYALSLCRRCKCSGGRSEED